MEHSKEGPESGDHEDRGGDSSTGATPSNVQGMEDAVVGEGSSSVPADSRDIGVDEEGEGESSTRVVVAACSEDGRSVSPAVIPAPGALSENDDTNSMDQLPPLPPVDLFHAVRYMTYVSELIYVIVAVRRLARDGAVDDSRLLRLPITLEEGRRLAVEHEEALRRHLGEESYDLFVGTRRDLSEARRSETARCDRDPEDARGAGTGDGGVAGGDGVGRPVVVEMGDVNDGATYNVGLNPRTRIVVVAFRGTSSVDDIVGDMRVHMTEMTNPVRGATASGGYSGGSKIMVHSGFHDYLFGSTSSSPLPPLSPRKDPDIQCPTRFDFILNLAIDILRANPGHRLYVTGHSLGAALATLFAFAAAASDADDIPHPVTCVNVASPMVGNIAFCAAFRALEESGRVRQLRIVNEEDVIPRGPARCILFSPANVYHHVGMELEFLREKPHYLIKFQDFPTGPIALLVYLLSINLQRLFLTMYLCVVGFWKVLKFHSCSSYSERIGASRHTLRKIHLKDLYDRALKQGERGVLVKG